MDGLEKLRARKEKLEQIITARSAGGQPRNEFRESVALAQTQLAGVKARIADLELSE